MKKQLTQMRNHCQLNRVKLQPDKWSLNSTDYETTHERHHYF